MNIRQIRGNLWCGNPEPSHADGVKGVETLWRTPSFLRKKGEEKVQTTKANATVSSGESRSE